jgi:hypothetical protein
MRKLTDQKPSVIEQVFPTQLAEFLGLYRAGNNVLNVAPIDGHSLATVSGQDRAIWQPFVQSIQI